MDHAADPHAYDAVERLDGGPTGDQVVDEALEILDGLQERPLKDHVPAFESVHGALQDRLAEGQR